jgi:HSP20 family protein
MSFLTRFEPWDPFTELSTLRDRINRLVARFGGEAGEELLGSKWIPAADVVETGDAIVMKVELPGMTEKDISLEVEGGVLTIKGERKAEEKVEEKGYRRIERSYGKFLRTFTLPPSALPDKIAAAYTDGLLEVRIPKKEEAKPLTINIAVKKLSEAA